MVNKIAVYPGSFDPFHNGHFDIVSRAAKVFDRIIIGVLHNANKKTLFTPQERIEMIKETVKKIPKIEVKSFEGLLVDFLKEVGALTIIRGLRTYSDFEYELQMAHINRSLLPTIETVFFVTKEEFSFLSSRLIKEIFFLKGEVDKFVSDPVLEALKKKYNEKCI